ncbi:MULTISPECIES: phosphatase PAP2 family protein [unclassified Aureispira]|uniref:phosphatase PAP2 family protein n=1 Tax=unclassified Aureispira TaxID=2649989 RepID=UPI000695A701|nr:MULTISPECIES: phosphatase PAP2 family protein [unclassified Aureispira]WMX14424.1 phosphatase PAP2 family protein [Aureispira sp. CCB-E]
MTKEATTISDLTIADRNLQAQIDHFVAENRWYIASFLLLWGIACYFLMGVLSKGDVILFFAENRSELKNTFFLFCTYIGEGYVYLLATIVLLFSGYSRSLAICLNAILVLTISHALKVFFAHERPVRYFDNLLEQPDLPNYVPDVVLLDGWTTSFPSGHTTSAFAFYSLLAFFIPNKWIKMLCLLLATLVGLSRMYLVQHFLKDVTTGMLTGFLIALIVYWGHEMLSPSVTSKKLRLRRKKANH